MCYRFCVDLDCPFYCSLILGDCLLQLDPSMDVVAAVAVAVTTTFAYGTGVLHGNFDLRLVELSVSICYELECTHGFNGNPFNIPWMVRGHGNNGGNRSRNRVGVI